MFDDRNGLTVTAQALTTADVGIAIGSGSDVAISSASFILVKSNLRSILTLTDLSRRVFNRVKFNFVSMKYSYASSSANHTPLFFSFGRLYTTSVRCPLQLERSTLPDMRGLILFGRLSQWHYRESGIIVSKRISN